MLESNIPDMRLFAQARHDALLLSNGERVVAAKDAANVLDCDFEACWGLPFSRNRKHSRPGCVAGLGAESQGQDPCMEASSVRKPLPQSSDVLRPLRTAARAASAARFRESKV